MLAINYRGMNCDPYLPNSGNLWLNPPPPPLPQGALARLLAALPTALVLFQRGLGVESAALRVSLVKLVGHGQFGQARGVGHDHQRRTGAGHAALAESGALRSEQPLVFLAHASGLFAGLLFGSQRLVFHNGGVVVGDRCGGLALGHRLLGGNLALHFHLRLLRGVVVLRHPRSCCGLLLLSVERHSGAGHTCEGRGDGKWYGELWHYSSEVGMNMRTIPSSCV
jgi:hypothetical protein